MILALVLGAASALHAGHLPPAPSKVWDVSWTRKLLPAEIQERRPVEPGGPAIEPMSGIVVAGTRDGKLRAFHPDGKRLWTFEADGAFESTPRIHNGVVYAGSRDGRLYAVSLDGGRQRWRYEAKEEVGTTPIVSAGTVFVMTLQDTLVAVDAETGKWKWHHRRDLPRGFTIRGAAGASVAAGIVYAAYSDGFVAALDAATGALRWERRVSPNGQFQDVDSTPVVSGGRVFVASYAGEVHALDAETGAEVWTSKAPGASRLALADGVLVALTTSQVLGLDPADGKALWTTPFRGTPAGNPLVLGNRVVVPTTRSVSWYDASTGRRLATLDPGTGISGAPAAAGSRMYVVTNGGTLIALDLS